MVRFGKSFIRKDGERVWFESICFSKKLDNKGLDFFVFVFFCFEN